MTAANRNVDLPTGKRHSKTQATLFEKMALAGHHVHRLADGSFLCCKYNLTKHCENFDELELFATKLGVLE